MVDNDAPYFKLQFFGAAGNVTGSCYLLSYKNTQVLIDCGLYQERDYLERNWEPFPFNPRAINAVLLTHGHLDHCGLLPKLFQEGFTGQIYSTRASLQIAEIILHDSARIQEEDAYTKKKRFTKQNRTPRYTPQALYTVQEVEKTMLHTVEVPYQKKIKVGRDLVAEFFNTGHIIGSAAIKVSVNQTESLNILFSGDIGRYQSPILQDPTDIPSAAYMVIESTYGGKDHMRTRIEEDISTIVAEAFRTKGKIIIPSFAIERTQELLYHLFILLRDHKIPSIPIYVDSPMAIKAIDVFKNNKHLYDTKMRELCQLSQNPFRFKELNLISSREESKKLNALKAAAIIIAGAGMCTGGRIKHHLALNIQNPDNFIVFVGYQAQNTLGRQILEKNETVRIFGESYHVKASIRKINGLSAHAGHSEIITWLKTKKEPPKRIFLTHGEEEATRALETSINEELRWKTHIPKYRETHQLF